MRGAETGHLDLVRKGFVEWKQFTELSQAVQILRSKVTDSPKLSTKPVIQDAETVIKLLLLCSQCTCQLPGITFGAQQFVHLFIEKTHSGNRFRDITLPTSPSSQRLWFPVKCGCEN